MKYLALVVLVSGFATVMAAEVPPAHPPIDHKALMNQIGPSGSDEDLNLQGTAVDVLRVSGYVYIEVSSTEGEKVWIAVPSDVVVETGDTVRYKEGPVMVDFRSNSLNRTFPAVMFLSRVTVTSNKQGK